MHDNRETPARCPVCGNPGWHDRDGWRECTHCGLAVRDGATLTAVESAIRAQLAAGWIDLAGDWTATPAALRNIAWAYGCLLEGNRVEAARACSHQVTLAIMGRGSEAGAIAAQVARLAGNFARIVLMIDGDAADVGVLAAMVSAVAVHPLAGDFAAQRNRLQDLAGGGWVLQLDTDEMPSPELLSALGWMTAAADRDGLRSLGLPRRNVVDGMLSALYPDIQYRLNRADIRFAGVVHERPQVPFAETGLALAGAIEHDLSAERVRARTRIYGGMDAKGARPKDEDALLRRYDGTPMASR